MCTIMVKLSLGAGTQDIINPEDTNPFPVLVLSRVESPLFKFPSGVPSSLAEMG